MYGDWSLKPPEARNPAHCAAAQSQHRLLPDARPDQNNPRSAKVGTINQIPWKRYRGGPQTARPHEMRRAKRGEVRRLRLRGRGRCFRFDKTEISGRGRAEERAYGHTFLLYHGLRLTGRNQQGFNPAPHPHSARPVMTDAPPYDIIPVNNA